MKKFLKVTGVLFLLVILAGLFLIYRYGPNFNVYLVPPSVEKYTQTALQFMEQGYFTDSDHWQAAKNRRWKPQPGRTAMKRLTKIWKTRSEWQAASILFS